VTDTQAFALGEGRELRLLENDDADELYALIDDNRAHLARWMQWAGDQTPERTRAFIRMTREQHAAGDGFQGAVVAPCATTGTGPAAPTEVPTGAPAPPPSRIVGVAGMHRIDWANRAVELGYWLAEDAQGKGVMTAAVAALVDHAFDEELLHRVQICAAVDNARSRALIERLGFTFEGVARQHYRIGDGYHDDAVYAMLATERPRRAAAPHARSATLR
jgi:ribosomal-protein-serine acetyltransferase